MPNLKGSCLCGKVRYVINGPLGPISHCHCPSCRKAHAAAFATVARIKAADFRIGHGEESLTAYESSPGKKRFFCSKCGSHIYSRKDGEGEIVLRVGTLDDDPVVRPSRHIFLVEKAPWYDLDAGLPRYDTWPK